MANPILQSLHDGLSRPSLFIRILIAGLACASLAFIVWQLRDTSPEAEMARRLLGEHWYRLSLDGRHLGYWHTQNLRDRTGNWIFESEQRFALDAADPVSTTARRVFAARPPHRLVTAEHLQSGRHGVRGVRIEARPDGYAVVRLPPDGTADRLVSWQYALADYLKFELWLDSEQPADGARRSVDTLDFERSARVARTFQIISRNDDGYVIENAAPLSATRIQLDRDYVPIHLAISGLFELTRSSRQAALAPRSALQAASYHIPTDRRLPDHTRVSRLVLRVEGADDPQALFGDMETHADGWRLVLQAPPVIGGRVGPSHREETIQLPSSHPDISSLAAGVVAGIPTETGRALALTEFVHRFVEYRPGSPPRGVLELLEDPRGDCTEFADLLTTLARSQGIPAATIFGLAYADGSEPAFTYHAWNELYADGTWIAVDPTWGELKVDATHIPLPEDETAALALLTGAAPLTFSILEVDHFPD